MSGPLYVYAIAGDEVALDDLTGIFGEPLHVVRVSGCHAIAGMPRSARSALGAPAALAAPAPAALATSAAPSAPAASATTLPPISEELLRAQDALVRELATRAAALLPARFGARFDDETALRELLESLTPRLAATLARVRDCEQMTVRLFGPPAASASSTTVALSASRPPATSTSDTPPAAAPPSASTPVGASEPANPESPGTAYLRRRARDARAAAPSPLVQALCARVKDLVRDERIEQGRAPVVALIHHLVPRGSAETYRTALAAGEALETEAVRIRVSGPSPVYAFAEADLR